MAKAKMTPVGRMILFVAFVVGLTLLFVYLRDNGHLEGIIPAVESFIPRDFTGTKI